jgi:hypothetical protein
LDALLQEVDTGASPSICTKTHEVTQQRAVSATDVDDVTARERQELVAPQQGDQISFPLRE